MLNFETLLHQLVVNSKLPVNDMHLYLMFLSLMCTIFCGVFFRYQGRSISGAFIWWTSQQVKWGNEICHTVSIVYRKSMDIRHYVHVMRQTKFDKIMLGQAVHFRYIWKKCFTSVQHTRWSSDARYATHSHTAALYVFEIIRLFCVIFKCFIILYLAVHEIVVSNWNWLIIFILCVFLFVGQG